MRKREGLTFMGPGSWLGLRLLPTTHTPPSHLRTPEKKVYLFRSHFLEAKNFFALSLPGPEIAAINRFIYLCMRRSLPGRLNSRASCRAGKTLRVSWCLPADSESLTSLRRNGFATITILAKIVIGRIIRVKSADRRVFGWREEGRAIF